MFAIGVYQYLKNITMYKHICLEIILYKPSRKSDDQQQYTATIESTMVSDPKVFTENIPMSPNQYVTVKNPSARKSLNQFLYTLDVKPKTAVRRFCAAKSNHKSTRSGSMLWSSILKRLGYPKINQQVKKSLYNWILQHIQVVVSLIENDCLKWSIDGQVDPQLFPKLLFQVSVRELHNSMVSKPEEGRLKEVREA